MAFLLKERSLLGLNLCNNKLPWVTSAKHLGTKLENRLRNILTQDMMEKRAQYIQRNNELSQEFSYAHWSTKVKINNIYNTHFTGSVIWDLFGKNAEMMYNTWNVSIRKMMRLSRQTHRHFIEPLSKTRHLKISLVKRFVKFKETLATTNKQAVRQLFNTIKDDCRSTTGRNLRKITILCETANQPTGKDIQKLSYRALPHTENWKVNMLEELLYARDYGDTQLGWKHSEISDCIEELCIL